MEMRMALFGEDTIPIGRRYCRKDEGAPECACDRDRDRDDILYVEAGTRYTLKFGERRREGTVLIFRGPAYYDYYGIPEREIANYEEWDTYLPKEMWEMIVGHVKEKGDASRLLELIEVCAYSPEGQAWGERVSADEREMLRDEYGFTDDDIDTIMDGAGFVDHAFVGGTYDDAEDYAREYADDVADIPDWMDVYIDYEAMGKDIIDDDSTLVKLDDGRIVHLNN